MGFLKGLIGCFSKTAHFEDVAHATFFFYFHFRDRFPELNEEQLRCMALLYGAFYEQKHHLAVFHIKYCIVHWVCGNKHIADLDELVLTFTEGVCRDYYPESARKVLDDVDYAAKRRVVIAQRKQAECDAKSGGGTLRICCRNVSLYRLEELCAELGHIIQTGHLFT